MQALSSIFKADPQSVFNVLSDRSSTSFYMPAYQRPYTWEEKHIRDLFTDFENVFRNLKDSSDAIIFLGTLLTVDDSQALTVYPLAKKHTPTNIKLVIDGQQRLSTLILIALCLNERLSLLLPKLKKIIDKETEEEFLEPLAELRETMSQLIKETQCFTIKTEAEHHLYRYFPKIIRSQVDCWGKDEKKAIYESPLAEFFISYQQHILSLKNTSFKAFDLTSLKETSSRVKDNVKEIRKQLDNVETGFSKTNDEDNGIVTTASLVNNETFEQCLDFPIDKNLASVSSKYPEVEKIVLISAFTKFLLHRVCLTYVEVNSESYAFDMFEALNTTGEPLTAIETFVPKVIEYIGNRRKDDPDFDHKSAMKQLNAITDRFEALTKAKDKNDKAKALILAFVRSYQGSVKVTSLRDQRDSMINSYDSCLNAYKDDYLYFLKETSDFLFDYWQAKKKDLHGLVHHSVLEEANLCLNYLTDINHHITLSLLIQFLLQDKQYQTLETEQSGFIQALKAITAFSVLWRTMSGGADGIDVVYKGLHEKGFELNGTEHGAYKLNNFSLTSDKLNIDDIKAYFREELDKKIDKKESSADVSEDRWIDICSSQQILEKPKNIKMLILAASHNLELTDRTFHISTEKRNNFYTMAMWNLLSTEGVVAKTFDIEKAEKDAWDSSLYSADVFNKLGNLLVDSKSNLSKSKTWHDLKQNMLQELGDVSINDIDALTCSELDISDEAKRVNARAMFTRKYEEITFHKHWNKDRVEERTKLLLKNAWRNLQNWLK